MAKPRFCWRKRKLYDGRMRLAPSFDCRLDGKHVAMVQQGPSPDQWYWYGGGHNSLGNNGNYQSLEQCKKDVIEEYTKNPWETTE